MGCEWEKRGGGRPFNYLNRVEGVGYSTFGTLTCGLFGVNSFLDYRPAIVFDRSDIRGKRMRYSQARGKPRYGPRNNPLLGHGKARLPVVLH